MKKTVIVFLICALPNIGRAQISSVGLFAGMNNGVNSAYTFQAGNYSIGLESMSSGLLKNVIKEENLTLNFGVFVEHNFLSKYSFSHSIVLHQYYPSYFIIGSPTGIKVSKAGIFAIKYNLMLRLFNKGGVRLLAGPGIDINVIEKPPQPTFNDNDLNEIATQLEQTFNPVVYYLGAELGYRAGRIDIALKYNRSLNSFTQPLEYQGASYGIPTRSAFLFLNIGFLVFDKALKQAKNK